MTGITWRRARGSDIRSLLALEAQFPSDGLTRRNLHYLMGSRSAEVWVGEIDRRIAAELILLFRAGSTVGRIYSVIVDPIRRGRGLGRAALVLAEDLARNRGCRALVLEVGIDNQPARALYADAGFRVIGQRDHYYVDGTAALKLRKNLAAACSHAIKAA